MKASTQGLLIAGSIALVGAGIFMLLRPRKKPKTFERLDVCENKDFWDGYHYNNPAAGEDGHVSSLPLGDKILVYRKDYVKAKNGQWVWVNPLDKKDIDYTLDPKSTAELDREEECRQKMYNLAIEM